MRVVALHSAGAGDTTAPTDVSNASSRFASGNTRLLFGEEADFGARRKRAVKTYVSGTIAT